MGGFSIIHLAVFALVATMMLGGGRFSALMGDVAKGVKAFKGGLSEDAPAAEPQVLLHARSVGADAAPQPGRDEPTHI